MNKKFKKERKCTTYLKEFICFILKIRMWTKVVRVRNTDKHYLFYNMFS